MLRCSDDQGCWCVASVVRSPGRWLWPGRIDQVIELLLPHLASARVKPVQVEERVVTFTVVSDLSAARCPTCGSASARTHGGYRRRLADLPIAG